MSHPMKLSRKMFSLLVASGIGVVALASPSVAPSKGGKSAAPTLAYKVAKADRPPPGGGAGAADAVCAKLGVGSNFHAQNAADCGMDNLGKLEPKATLCATPPPTSNSLKEGDGHRTCEACVPTETEKEKCSGEREVKANVGGGFSITYLGKSIECNGNAEFYMKANTKFSVGTSSWKRFNDKTGTDGPVEYMSEISHSTTGGEASISLGGGCTVDGTVVKVGAKVDIGLKCKIETSKTFGSRTTREGTTCGGEDPKPCAGEMKMDMMTGQPVCVEVDEPGDAGTPTPTPTEPEVVTEDAGALPMP